ncbi:MAG: V-type ATPase subunit [Oscillospiraceae bacterium]|nr:V-type ATPase subunit [Oscillospiraceae bacterium]
MNLKSPTSNVIVTKLRSLYGKSLDSSAYEQLINKYSVSGVASYLKNETLYSSTLESINENSIHRGQLELLLKISNFDKYRDLFYYKTNENFNMFKYVILKNELEQMMIAIRLFNTGEMKKYAVDLPVFLLKYTKIDLKKIADAKNFDDLLDLSKETIYYKSLKQFKPIDGKIDIVRCETELRKTFYNKIISLIDKKDKKTLEILLLDIEILNISIIYRLKKFFNKDKEYIKSCLLPFFYYLSEEIIDKMIDSKTTQEMLKIILTTKYKKYCDENFFSDISFFSKKILYNILKKGIRFTNSSQYVMISYIYLMDIELKNIITIIECIGYKFETKEIKKFLII